MTNYIKFVPCPLCGCRNNSPFSFEQVFLEGKTYKLGVNKCKKCRLVYISPRLNSFGLTNLYNENYNLQTISSIYSKSFDTSASEYLTFKKYVYEYLPDGGKILDIGCGTGNFLSQFAENPMYSVEGTEVSYFAGKEAMKKGIKVYFGDLLSLQLPEKEYDIISMLYVLEHIPNPMNILEEAYRLLKSSGHCLIAVPNYNYLRLIYVYPMSFVLFKKKTYLHADEHLQNFTPSTLLYMVNKVGFTPVRWECALPFDVGSRPVKIAKKVLSIVVHGLFRAGIHLGGIHLIAKKV